MRIAVFIKSTTFHSGYGGLETQNKVLCEGLAKRGHEVAVFSPERGTKKYRGIAKELSLACNPRRRRMDTSQLLSETTIPETCLNVNDAGVDYIFVPCVYRMMFSSVDRNNWLNKSYQEFIKGHRQDPFDVIISQSSAGLGVIKKKHELGIKVVGISHGTIGGEMKTLLNSAKSPFDMLKSAKSLAFGLTNFFGRQRQYIHGCDAVVAVSSAVKKSIIDETYAPEEKITVIHNGMDSNKVPKKVWKKTEADEPLKILYIGRIEESKGLRELLEACKDLNQVVLNIVGDGPYLEELKALSRRLKMSQKVLFYGKLPFEKAVEMYACNDVFVLPTKRVEGLPMTLVEACFAGLPIIATDMGGNKDAVEDGYNGFLLTKLKVEILKQKLIDLAENRALTEKLGTNGKIKAEQEFDLDKMISAYERICSFE